jgi:hypothetical protein
MLYGAHDTPAKTQHPPPSATPAPDQTLLRSGTPKSGAPLVSACQDFLTASFLLTQRDTFLTRDLFCALCVYMSDGKEAVVLPEPALVRPVTLWTGKQASSDLVCLRAISVQDLHSTPAHSSWCTPSRSIHHLRVRVWGASV